MSKPPIPAIATATRETVPGKPAVVIPAVPDQEYVVLRLTQEAAQILRSLYGHGYLAHCSSYVKENCLRPVYHALLPFTSVDAPFGLL